MVKDSFSSVAVFYTVFVALLLASCTTQPERRELQLGDTAPDFAIKDLSGNVQVLSSKKGKPVIVRFFETDCRFCKADTPVFTKFYNEHKDNGLEVIYIGSFYENEKALRAFVNELNPDFPVAMDVQGRLADLYGIIAYPMTLFISPDQKILAAILGGVGEAELNEIFTKYL